MKASTELRRLSQLALRQRRQGLAKLIQPIGEILRGSLVERYVTCGNPSCKCARGERHGPVWYLTVTLGRGRTTGSIIAKENLPQVRGWIENYHTLKDHLEKISEINRELLRRQRPRRRKE
jgi:hypothetical protein